MMPYSTDSSSVFFSQKDCDNLINSLLPKGTEKCGFEIYYTFDEADPHGESVPEYNMDLFTFLLDDSGNLADDQLYYYQNGGDQDTPVIVRELKYGIWGYPQESDAHYLYLNRLSKAVKTVMFTDFLYEAAARGQKIQDLKSVHARLFSGEQSHDDGYTLYQYTINPDSLGAGEYNIIVFAELVRRGDDWVFFELNNGIQCDPEEFIRRYGFKG